MTAQPDPKRAKAKAASRSKRPEGRPSDVMPTDEIMVVTGGRLTMAPFNERRGIFEWINDDEVIRTKGFAAYDQMQHDDTIKAALAMKSALVSGRKYEMAPAGDGEQDKEVAQFVQDQLEKIQFNRVLRETCTSFRWGYAVAEVVWELSEWKGQQVIGIKKVAFRDPKRLWMHTDAQGNMKRVRQWPDFLPGSLAPQTGRFMGTSPIDLPMDRLFHYAHQSEFRNPYGTSDLRSIYKNWWAKKFIVQFWNVFLERLGSPLMTVKYPQGADNTLKETIKKILNGLSAKTEVMVPEGVVFELVEATRAGNGDYSGALNYHDTAIAKGILVPALLGFQSGNPARGSDSQSRLHLRTLFKITGTIGDEMASAFKEQVIKKLVDFNFDVKEYPEFNWNDYGEFESFELTDAIRLLHAAGILDMDGADVNYARGLLGLPIRDEDNADKVVRPPEPPPPASANAPPPKAEQGNVRGQGGQRRTGSGGSTGAASGQ